MLEKVFKALEEINPWKAPYTEVGFWRESYLQRIIPYLGNRLVKVFVGQRRAGKSYLLRQLIKLLMEEREVPGKNVFYLNKEFIGFEQVRSASDLEEVFQYYLKQMSPEGRVYIFLDEIQNVERWEVFVNSYSQHLSGAYEVFVTGSNSALLSGELATFLSGRYVEFSVYPFGFEEYCAWLGKERDKRSLLEYIRTGGLPELLMLPTEEVRRHYVSSLRDTILLRDIVGRYGIKDVVLLERLFDFIAVNIGNLTSVSSIVKYFKQGQKKTNYETLSAYLEYLLRTFLMHKVPRYRLRGKEILEGAAKYYLNDPGFRTYLHGYYPGDVGYHLENYVFMRLKARGYKVYAGVLDRGREIDFVAEKGPEKLYVQVAYLLSDRKVIDREFGNLQAIRDHYPKWVLSMDEAQFSDFAGIRHAQIWKW